MSWSLAVHGGAYNEVREGPADQQEPFLRELLRSQAQALGHGTSALDVVTATVSAMEDSGLFNAGKGAVTTTHGHAELDAGIMDGSTMKAGAVASIRDFKNPILCARGVMERTKHVLLVGEGAEAYLRGEKFEEVEPTYYTHATAIGHDTIGAVARDSEGRLAVATSTGGISGKLPGRVGDSPVVGAGTWADKHIAVSCTGTGEYFIRTAAGSWLAFLVGQGKPLAEAAEQVMAAITEMGGTGGLIAIDAAGNVTMPFISKGMVRGRAAPGILEVTA